MKLTHRQLEFLERIEQLQENNQDTPIHYSALAQSLDISNSTAYHMLRLLEKKGCVISQYQLPEVRIGRSSVVFEISNVGRQVLTQ